jgi:8-amino-7-oxononanoate synthase
VPGAYVVGSRLLRELLINRCRHFIFTTALPPLVGAWWLDALERVAADERRRGLLHNAARRFRHMLLAQDIAAPAQDYIVPVILGDDDRAVAIARQAQQAGFDVRAIRPPTVPPGTARLRISIHADHDTEVLGRLAEVLGRALRGNANHVA